MVPAVVLADGPRLLVVEAGGPLPPVTCSLGATPPEAARRYALLADGDFPGPLVQAVRALPRESKVVAADPRWVEGLARAAGRPVRTATVAELRAARSRLDRTAGPEDRAFLLAVARRTLETALASPEEVLVALAREEDRLERALGREARAADHFLAVPGTLLETYAPAWEAARRDLERHHAQLLGLLEESARRVAPNLASLVGERVAGRLVAAAGSLPALARMNSSRLQLLGSRRRPSPVRGPRYGVLFRAVRMNDLPVARRGAYARSLAALAVVAARADATTHADVALRLIARRDRRIEELRRRDR